MAAKQETAPGAAAHERLPAAILKGYLFYIGAIQSAHRSIRGEYYRLAARQNLRPAMDNLPLCQLGQRDGGTARGGNALKNEVDGSDNVSVLAPTAATNSTEWGVA